MATCDPDGRIAQMVGDQLACLAMSLNESVNESVAEWERLYLEAE